MPLQVGFLKILHRYEITFLLPPSQRLGKDVCALPLPNPNLKVLTVAAVPEGKDPPPNSALCAPHDSKGSAAAARPHLWARGDPRGDPQQTLGLENSRGTPTHCAH